MAISHLQPVESPVAINFDAERLSRAWLTVAVACATEGPHSRQIIVEHYPQLGVRLVGTDGYILLTAFVPDETMEEMGDWWPSLDELPEETYVVSDEDKRGLDLLKFAFRTVKPSGSEPKTVTLTIGAHGPEAGQFENMSRKAFSLEFPADDPISESVSLGVIEREVADWRGLFASLGSSAPVHEVQLATSLVLKRLADIGTHWPTTAVRIEFTGPSRLFRIVVPQSFYGIEIVGCAMPQNIEDRED